MFSTLIYRSDNSPSGWWVEFHQAGKLQKRVWYRDEDFGVIPAAILNWSDRHVLPEEP